MPAVSSRPIAAMSDELLTSATGTRHRTSCEWGMTSHRLLVHCGHSRPGRVVEVPGGMLSHRHDRARRRDFCPAADHQHWPDLAMHDAGSANDRRQSRMFALRPWGAHGRCCGPSPATSGVGEMPDHVALRQNRLIRGYYRRSRGTSLTALTLSHAAPEFSCGTRGHHVPSASGVGTA